MLGTTMIIIGCVVWIGMLFLFCAQRRELQTLKTELRILRRSDSNQKLHSYSGLVDREFIDEINQLLKEVADHRIYFKRRNHEIEQMMTNISHDLRTPLTSALGYIEMIEQTDMAEEEKKEALHIAKKRLQRLKELIDAFFEFSKAISSEKAPELSETNLVAVLEEAISHYYDDYCDRGRSIVFRCAKHRILLQTNKNMLMRIFDNLIINALKHGEGDLEIVVTDEPGIAICFSNEVVDQELDVFRIFDEFYTTDISRTKGNTGLGLAIVKQFAQMLGWQISAEKKENRLEISLEILHELENHQS